jgi:hypothetical protein
LSIDIRRLFARDDHISIGSSRHKSPFRWNRSYVWLGATRIIGLGAIRLLVELATE